MLKLSFLVISCIAFLSFCHAQSFVYEGGQSTFKGNKFDLLPTGTQDSEIIKDPVTDKKITKRFDVWRPEHMNGKKIYVAKAVISRSEIDVVRNFIERYIINSLKNDCFTQSLPDGTVRIDHFRYLVIDEHGKIVYYNDYYPGFIEKNDGLVRCLSAFSTIDSILTTIPPIKFSTLKNSNSIVLLNISLSQYLLKVNNHVVEFSE